MIDIKKLEEQVQQLLSECEGSYQKLCIRYGMQWCHLCENLECEDNLRDKTNGKKNENYTE